MAALPPDLQEHAGSLVVGLCSVVALLGGALAVLWKTREKEKEGQVAAALRELGEKFEAFGEKFDGTVLRIFERFEKIEHENAKRDIRCAALHGKGPGGWDGTERRKVPR